MAVRRVIKFRPATISDGLYDHRAMKAGPFTNSNRKTSVFNPMIRVVIAGKREGLRSMSLSGIIVHLDFSHSSTIFIHLRSKTPSLQGGDIRRYLQHNPKSIVLIFE